MNSSKERNQFESAECSHLVMRQLFQRPKKFCELFDRKLGAISWRTEQFAVTKVKKKTKANLLQSSDVAYCSEFTLEVDLQRGSD
jgi:hypothetical protein